MTTTALAVDPSIKSRPLYQPEGSLPKSEDYLFVIEPCARERLTSLLRYTEAARVTVLVSHDAEGDGRGSQSVRDDPGIDAEAWEHLKTRLIEELGKSTIGCRLVVMGSEAFLWDVRGLALEQGMIDQEISLYPVEGRGRRVFCAHCRTLTEAVLVSPVACSGCGTFLEVRDHFSRRLGAYMGVCIDAEEPGVIPPQEELG
jgi:hypothetical protein